VKGNDRRHPHRTTGSGKRRPGGPHLCDGANGGAHPSPVPTPTVALDTAARLTHSGWDGTSIPVGGWLPVPYQDR